MEDLYNTISSLPPKSQTIFAFLIGFLLLDDLSADRQIALGNIFILIGQTLIANGTVLRLVEIAQAEKEHQQLNSMITDFKDRIEALEAKNMK